MGLKPRSDNAERTASPDSLSLGRGVAPPDLVRGNLCECFRPRFDVRVLRFVALAMVLRAVIPAKEGKHQLWHVASLVFE